MPTNIINRKSSARLLSLDFFRGLAILGMILVNNPGSNEYVYQQLSHAPWNGCSFADLVFPFFLFAVGISIALSKRFENKNSHTIFIEVAKRTFILFFLGIFLEFFSEVISVYSISGKFDLSGQRFTGVLQRIAICYFFVSMIAGKFKERTQYLTAAVLLIAYWMLFYIIPVPGHGIGNLSLEGNLCGYIDRLIIGPSHLCIKSEINNIGVFDPEGILSTIPSIVTTMLGYFLGLKLKRSILNKIEIVKIIGVGILMVFAGLLINPFFPINKKLWTSSYVLFTGGIASIFFIIFYYIIDVKQWKHGIMPLVYLGANAITIYLGSAFFAVIFEFIIKVPGPQGVMFLKDYIYQCLLAPIAGDMAGSLLYSILYAILWILIARDLYRSKVFIKA